MLPISSLLAIALVLNLAIIWYIFKHSRRSIRHPPGPRGIPILGNLLQMPTSSHWLKFADWARKYGPLTYVNVAGQPMLIVNTQEAAIDLLVQRESIYSDRPSFIMAGLSGFAETSLILGMSAMQRVERKMIAQALEPHMVQRDYVTIVEQSARRFAQSLLEDPDSFFHHIQRLTGGVVQSITYGANCDGRTDFVDLGNTDMVNFGKVIAGYAVDIFPLLRFLPAWFPGAGFKREAKQYKAIANETRWMPFNMVKKQLSSRTAPQSFIRSALETEEYSHGDLNDSVISAAGMSIFGAGSSSMAGTLSTFMLAMLLHPEVQERARAEIDRVVGGDRLPVIADKEATPYLNAIILETFRWHPIFPIGVPHRLIRDDVYEGQLIPAGTTVFVNMWGILNDENNFADPSTFNPNRFLNMNKPNADIHDNSASTTINPWDVVFGYGGRMCQGKAVADIELWMTVAMILACFEIRPKVDPKTSEPLIPKASWTGATISFPEPFVCNITPRSSDRAERIREAVVKG
ncbi:hypothetical protein FRB98_002518 [Tulasnella sp. 332]|nr:hypothetical protein FRB98_002518 [Tulasnella sp. 332]